MSELDRFKRAQERTHDGYEPALAEIESGGKSGHWIWYIFPQLGGLGSSVEAQTYAIDGYDEAVAYLRDSVLAGRYVTITRVVAEQVRRGVRLRGLLGSHIDTMKLVSSLTLFGGVARRLADAGEREHNVEIARLADEILIAAEEQGYPRCTFTLRALEGEGES